jgi:hypothetical protein
MLGRKDYTSEEVDHGKAAVKEQLAAFKRLAKLMPSGSGLLRPFETTYFNNMAIVLDRYYVHRIRTATGKDSNALNEVELITDSLMNNGGTLQGNNVIKYVPEDSVVGLKIGDPIALTADQFQRLSAAFFAELERRFL